MTIAGELGCTPAQVALAWLRQRNALVIPILGARSEAQIKDNLGCLSVRLSDEQIKRLDGVSAIEPGYPHEFLARDYIRKIIYSGRYDSIDNHRRLT